MTPRVDCPAMGAGQQARGTYSARAAYADRLPPVAARVDSTQKEVDRSAHLTQTGPATRTANP